MVEPIMYLAIGFLLSMLCGLAIVPLVHNRAVRLTTRRLEAATPLSMAEIQADKDQLRAEFAMSARRLEMSVDQLKNKTTSQLAELGKKSDAINRMKIELGEKNATIFALEAREKAVKEQLRATEEEFNAKTASLREAEIALSNKQGELAKINSELSDRSLMAESRQVELVAVRAQIEELKNRVGDAEKEFVATQARLAQERTESETASRELGDARGRVENLSQRVTELDRQLMLQVKEAEMLSSRVADLEGRLATQGKLLAERDYENNQLRQANEGSERTIKDLRVEIASLSGGKSSAAVETLRTEKAALEEQLRSARDERAKLQRDINAIQQQAESSWATERMENALLRAHQRHRCRGGQARDAARRPELADRGPARGRGRPAAETGPAPGQRCRDQWRGRKPPARGRWNAGRAHPGAAGPRLPRPPAGRVSRLKPALTAGSRDRREGFRARGRLET
jgi:chromosome segregation ATPase